MYHLFEPLLICTTCAKAEKAEQLKREIKENRRGERNVQSSGDRPSTAERHTSESVMLSQEPLNYLATPVSDLLPATGGAPWPQYEVDGMLYGGGVSENVAPAWPDAYLFMFYLENFLPFLFPFYRPTPREGGRSWILDMMMSSPVVRQTALCQSSYFFSLALGTSDCDVAFDRVLAQTREAFESLGQSLRTISEKGISENLPEAVRCLGSIMQVQRFDIAVSDFENCEVRNIITAHSH